MSLGHVVAGIGLLALIYYYPVVNLTMAVAGTFLFDVSERQSTGGTTTTAAALLLLNIARLYWQWRTGADVFAHLDKQLFVGVGLAIVLSIA